MDNTNTFSSGPSSGALSHSFNAAAAPTSGDTVSGSQATNPTAAQDTALKSELAQSFDEAGQEIQAMEPQHAPLDAGEPTIEDLRTHLAQLEKTRPTPKVEQHYTIGGTTETEVHTKEWHEREALIARTRQQIAEKEKDLKPPELAAPDAGPGKDLDPDIDDPVPG